MMPERLKFTPMPAPGSIMALAFEDQPRVGGGLLRSKPAPILRTGIPLMPPRPRDRRPWRQRKGRRQIGF